MKNLLLALVRKLPIGAVRQEMLLFFLKLGYFPNFTSPKTFNEKINHRKLFLKDSLMVSCMDKIAVRDYVAAKIGPEYLISVLYHGDSITAEQLHGLGDDVVAKPSHDSKSTEIIRRNSAEVAEAAATRLQAKVTTDFGKKTNQFAYSDVPRQVLVEKMLVEQNKVTPDDFKIFCFRQADGSIRMYVELHENREQPDYKVSWYDDDLEPIEIQGDDYVTRSFPCPEKWPKMREIAETLSADFDHVRIDLYHVEGRIYFGEMTFFDGGGRTEYSTVGENRHDLDREMGRIWTMKKRFPCSPDDTPMPPGPPSNRASVSGRSVRRVHSPSMPPSKV